MYDFSISILLFVFYDTQILALTYLAQLISFLFNAFIIFSTKALLNT